MKKHIAVLPGDGIGPEIIAQALRVLQVVAEKYHHTFEYEEGFIGAAAIDQTGKPLPEETVELCKKSDAVLFGAIGHPKYDQDPKAKVRPEQGLLALRKSLQLYANIRPVATYDNLIHFSPLKEERIKNTNFVVVRELTGGIYFGEPRGRSENGEKAFDTCVYDKNEIQRVTILAFEMAKTRKNHLTLVDKANVLATSRLWRETVQELSAQYPQVEVDYMFVDNAAMQIIQRPSAFDVVLTENMFGDILSDEASVITGSLGLLPSASMGVHTSLFEPIHGSYPQAAGKNIANPLATILSAAMMLDNFDMKKEAQSIKDAVASIIDKGILTEDLSPEKSYTTSEVGDALCENIN